jgi:uncharacterized LabA/DUF88 family protein
VFIKIALRITLKTFVYIDGFNLYYGCLRNTNYRWLDPAKLLQFLLPKDQISQINYYTALVSARPHDPDKPVRQSIYLRALQTVPNLRIHLGHFLSHEIMMRLAHPPAGQSPFVKVIKTEEKGSDVNLATHLVHDGHLGKYELAVVVSNDSDLAEPVRIVTHELGLKVGILNPHQHPSKTLIANALFHKNIRQKVLGLSQFPAQMTDTNGPFHKPPGW